MRWHWSLSRTLSICLLLTSVPPGFAEPSHLTIYLGLVHNRDEPAEVALQEWAQFVHARIRSEVYDVMDRYYHVAREPFVVQSSMEDVPRIDQLAQLWKEQGAIYVLSAIASRSGSTARIESTIFLGDLHGNLPSKLLTLDQVVKDTDYESSVDAITAVTLYGLGQEVLAERRIPTACGIFKLATEKLLKVDVKAMGAADLPVALQEVMRANKCA